MPAPAKSVKAVFDQAVELDTPADRAAFLDRACAGEPGLRDRLEGLLRAHADAGSFLDRPAAGPPETAVLDSAADPTASGPAPAPEAGAVVAGRYKLLEVIGAGGMGTVWLAEQHEPVRRRVALKLIKPGMDSEQVLARFEAERQALALMSHPNIATVLDGGVTAGGRPFFVMELVAGVPVTAYCDANKLTPRQRLELFVPVCHAIQHAHQKGVIHRDVKPSNVLVAVYDGVPVPKVIDFGVAKATGPVLTDRTAVTGFGSLVGTLEYMSPEQASFDQPDVDTRTDVYSLGVLLYELLTGGPPFSRKEQEAAGLLEVLRLIREQEPPRPSVRLSTADGLPTLAANRGTEPRRLTALVRGDLDWIVMKALEKDRARRYETASDLARNVQLYLADEPVDVRPPTVGYRLRKFARAHRGILTTAAAIAVFLIAGASVSTWQAVRATTARDAEALERLRAVVAERIASDRLEDSRRASYFQGIARADLEFASGNIGRAEQILDACQAEYRHWEWRYLKRQCHTESLALTGHTDQVRSVAFCPDGRLLASAGDDQIIRLWDLSTGQLVREMRGHELRVSSVAFSPDGRLLASASGDWLDGKPGELKVWDVATGDKLFGTRPHRGAIAEVAFMPDGRLVTAGWDTTVRVHSATTGDELAILKSKAGTFKCVAVSPDGKLIAAGSRDRLVVLWDAATGKELNRLQGHTGDVLSIAFSPDGKWLVSAGYDPMVRSWNLVTGKAERSYHGNTEIVYRVAFSPDGKRIASASMDGTVRVWDRNQDVPRRVIRAHGQDVYCVAFSPGGSSLATGGWDQVVKIWDSDTVQGGRTLATPTDRLRRLSGLAVSPDGRLIAAACDNPATHADPGRVLIWDSATRRMVREFGEHVGGVRVVAFSPDGRRLAADSGRDVKIWDPRTGKELARLEGHRAAVAGLAYSRDGRYLASAGDDGTILLWDLTPEKPSLTRELRGHDGPVTSVAFSPDGRRIASGGRDRTARVWDVDSGRTILSLVGHDGPVTCVAYSLDGSRLASSSEDSTARVWDADTGRELVVLRGHAGPVRCVAFSGDGRRLATGSADGSVCLWDSATGQEALALRRQMINTVGIAFGDGSRTLVACGRELRNQRFCVTLWDAGEASAEADGKRLLSWHAREAEGFEAHGQWRSALTHLDRLIEARPDDASGWNARAWCYLRAGEWEKAIADYSRSIELEPTDETAWGSRAWCGEHLGQWERARDDYSKGIELKPDYWEGWVGRARCHSCLGQWEQAAADFAGTVRLQPNGVDHWYFLAVAHLGAGNVQGYRGICRDMLNRFGATKSPGVASQVLHTCLVLPDVAADPQHVVKLGHLSVGAFRGNDRTLGAALYRSGQYTAAVDAFKLSAASPFPLRAWDWCFLAMCHHRLGDDMRARFYLDLTDRWIAEADRAWLKKPAGSQTTWYHWCERVEVHRLRDEAGALDR